MSFGLSILLTPLWTAAAGVDFNARRQSYGFDSWREAEGLPQSGIRAITQTRDGYIWLATDNGAVRFNGTTFTAFTIETGSLKDNEVWALQEDAEQALWIGTYGGGVTRFKDGRFKTFTTADGLPDDVVTRIEKDPEGSLWMSTPRGICRYSKGKFATFTTADGLSGNHIGPISASRFGVFAATASRVHRFAAGRFETLPGIAQEGDGAIEQLVCARDGSLWVGFSNATITHWKNGRLKVYNWRHSGTPQVTLLREDPQGVLWAGLDRRLYKLEQGEFQPVPLEDHKPDLGIIYSMSVDHEGSIWLGFQADGLGRLRVKQLFTLSDGDGLPNESARSAFQDKQGNIWIGTASGFAKYSHGQVLSYSEWDGRRLGPIRSFAEDESGTIWIAAGNDLLTMRQGRLARVSEFHSNSRIEAIYAGSRGGMWIGTDGDGLFEFAGGRFFNYTTREGLAGNRVHALLLDRQGALWVSTFGAGVSKYAAGRFETYGPASGLAGSRVTAIHEDEEGALWFAARGGLSRLKDGKFFHYTSESGLLVNFIYSILDDGRGNFWFSCAQGLFRVSKAELRDFAAGKIRKLTSVSYGVRDGMKTRAGNTGNQPTAWKTHAGTLLFSSMKGVVVVSPEHIASSKLMPPVYLESVKINRLRQELNAQPRLPAGAGDLEIAYTALNFLEPENVRFKYILEGFDSAWVDAGGRRFAYYANLPPGQYRFRVQAGSADGAWNEAGASFSFYLSPHFYRTKLFLALLVSCAAGLIWLLYALRMHEVKARYSAVLAERNRISGDIHDTFAQNLAGIALQLDSVTMHLDELPPVIRERLDEACSLTRYSLAEARRAMTDLRTDDLERVEVAEALPEIARRMSAGVQVETSFNVVGAPKPLSRLIEKNLLRVFREAMANALKHARARTIEVELKYGETQVALLVLDDGCGFDTANASPLANGHYGLIGMRERAEKMGACLTLRSSPGLGTEMRIEIPLEGCGSRSKELAL